MNQLNIFGDFVLCMCKRTKVFIVAFVYVVWVELTELCLVTICVVKLL